MKSETERYLRAWECRPGPVQNKKTSTRLSRCRSERQADTYVQAIDALIFSDIHCRWRTRRGSSSVCLARFFGKVGRGAFPRARRYGARNSEEKCLSPSEFFSARGKIPFLLSVLLYLCRTERMWVISGGKINKLPTYSQHALHILSMPTSSQLFSALATNK